MVDLQKIMIWGFYTIARNDGEKRDILRRYLAPKEKSLAQDLHKTMYRMVAQSLHHQNAQKQGWNHTISTLFLFLFHKNLVWVTRLELAASTTPTRVHQRLSQNNLRKRQISCETTADLAKWTNIFSKNYEPNRENYAPDCARFCDGILHEKCLEIHANTENAVLFFCNGVVIDLLHFNSEKRRCQGLSKRIIVTSLCWTQTRRCLGLFSFPKEIFADFNREVNHLTHG